MKNRDKFGRFIKGHTPYISTPWNKGKTKKTDDRIKRLAELASMRPPPMAGKKHKPETIEKLKKLMADGRWHTPNRNKHLRDIIRLSKKRAKIVSIKDRKIFEYLLGVFQGDGTLSYAGKKNPSALVIPVAYKDSNYADVLMRLIRECFGINASLGRDKSCLRVSVYSVNLCKFFLPYKKDYYWKIPRLKYPWEWLAGVIDTDGSVSKKRNSISLVQKRKENLELVLSLGLWDAKIYCSSNKYSLESGNSKERKKLRENLPLKHPRKRKILMSR